MNKFGELKNKVLVKLTESYETSNKKEVKNVLKAIKKDKNFKELYLFYESIEGKYFDDKEIAKFYIEEITSLLKNKLKLISDLNEKFSGLIEGVDAPVNPLYESLDMLIEEETLENVDKKLLAKRNLINHLTTKKDIVSEESSTTVPNEHLLYAVLSNNFNTRYEETLEESEKLELKRIISMSDEEVESMVNNLKEEIISKVSSILSEDTNEDERKKIEEVKRETNLMSPTKFNYYKLKQLKEDLD